MPTNVFRASVWAIDLILHDAEQSPPHSEAPIDEPVQPPSPVTESGQPLLPVPPTPAASRIELPADKPNDLPPPEAANRLIINRKPPCVALDGIRTRVTEKEAAFVDILNKKVNEWVKPATFAGEPFLRGVRLDRLKKELPPEIRDLIQGKPGKGYKLTLA
jgi:hypothetical protein